jgi:predicted enzyme related to lactoylglutathione lyase
MQHGVFVWNEFMTRDVEGTKAFYTTAVGWRFEGMPMSEGTYWIAKSGDQMVAGIMAMPSDDPRFEHVPDHWLPYLEVDDVIARTKQAESAGATVIKAPFEVPGIGTIVILAQPGGGVVGWMTSVSRDA